MKESSRMRIIGWAAGGLVALAGAGQAAPPQMCGGGSGRGSRAEQAEVACCRMDAQAREMLLRSSQVVRDLMAQVASDRATLEGVAAGDTLGERLLRHERLLGDLLVVLSAQEGLLTEHLLEMAGEDARAPEGSGHQH